MLNSAKSDLSRNGILVNINLTLFFKKIPAQNRHRNVRALTMATLKNIGRLFTIRTRFEAWLVIYAIALGAVERGQHYLQSYPGWSGWLLAFACTGVVFIAGAKLLDSVRPMAPALASGPYVAAVRRRHFTGRNRPKRLPRRRALESRISRRTD